MPYFEGTGKYGFLQNTSFDGRVIFNLEVANVRPTDPEIISVNPFLEKLTKGMKATKAVRDVVVGGMQVRAGLLLLFPDPFFGPADEVVGIGLIGKGGWQATKGMKSLAELTMN